MLATDSQYVGLPWKRGGRDRSGLDCAGLALLFLQEQFNFTAPSPKTDLSDPEKHALAEQFLKNSRTEQHRGDLVFFRWRETGQITHVAIYLGCAAPQESAADILSAEQPNRGSDSDHPPRSGKYLHITAGGTSRIENGLTLLTRLGYERAGAISPKDAEAICATLNLPQMGWTAIVMIVISIALSLASAFLMPRPKLGKLRSERGRYGYDGMYTQTNSELPLPDLLGAVTIAGNAPYTSLQDKTLTVTDATTQKANKIVILCASPMAALNDPSQNIKINGLQLDNEYFKNFSVNPAQTKAEAVDGTIDGVSNVPSVSIYKNDHAISVPVDIRATYDRNFPVYGFSGCSYLVFRLIDSNKFQNFSMTANVWGRKCRTFTTAGFTKTTVTAESLTGANGTKVRFKLANFDIAAVTSVTVNSTAYSLISPTAQTGFVYHLNRTKGYIEFITAPANGAAILVSYTYYPRAFTQNPASHLVYLLSEPIHGKGVDESRLTPTFWQAAVDFRDYCDQSVTWRNATGTTTQPRYRCNYAIDFRKDIQDHVRAVLDSCYGYLFQSNGTWIMKPRKSETSVFSFNPNNILRDTFWSEQITRSDRANLVKAFIHPADTYNAEAEVSRADDNDIRARSARIGNNGIVDMTVKLPAVDDFSQAERMAETLLREEVNTRWACGFKTNILGVALEPGDVIDVTHGSRPNWSEKLFRIEDIDYDPEDRMLLKCSEYVPAAYI